jgi:MerR family transcriptional regulator, light-induced transcriptional regulator
MNDGASAGRGEDEPDIGAGLSIQRVSDLLAVPAPTIRSWERRYGVPAASRSSGGHRRYFPHDLTMLRKMRDEISRGRRAADAAATVKEGSSADIPHLPLISAFLKAAYSLDPTGVREVLDRALDTFGLDEAASGVLLPAMSQIGRWWESGECDVAHEHLATDASRAWLNKQLFLGPKPQHPESIILTCGPRDFHTLGLEAMGVLLSHRGWSCRSLGARTPARALVTAVSGTGASAVVMVSHLSVARRAAVEALRFVQPSGALIFYAGNAFVTPQARHGVPGTYLGESLVRAADLVTSDMVSRRSARNAP